MPNECKEKPVSYNVKTEGVYRPRSGAITLKNLLNVELSIVLGLINHRILLIKQFCSDHVQTVTSLSTA